MDVDTAAAFRVGLKKSPIFFAAEDSPCLNSSAGDEAASPATSCTLSVSLPTNFSISILPSSFPSPPNLSLSPIRPPNKPPKGCLLCIAIPDTSYLDRCTGRKPPRFLPFCSVGAIFVVVIRKLAQFIKWSTKMDDCLAYIFSLKVVHKESDQVPTPLLMIKVTQEKTNIPVAKRRKEEGR